MTHPDLSVYRIKDRGLVISVCSKIDIMSHYLDFYIENGVEEVSKEGFEEMKKLLAFCCAFTRFLPRDTIFSCNVSLPISKRKHFCVFDVGSKTFVARSHKWMPKEYDKSPRLAVQKASVSSDINSVSMVDCLDEPENDMIVNMLIDRYFEVHGGGLFRVFEGNSGFFVVSFLESDEESREKLLDLIPADLEKTVELSEKADKYFYEFKCGCDAQRMSSLFSVISKEDIDYLFENGDEISVDCPRCGLKYTFKRGDLEKN
ncbi:MAG TPA: Hsp33 family molecular chaperone HslO [bacterium]|jgi:hypothetical protein|nr:Hsp33 family molecular chaperone HslO [bacterium]HQJ60745.1 Hsp33 family molecular chaperone HslO [bacterium]HQN72352.1 Hsp33 family molecular chaperone HslO [bacterium]HQO91856.1 Hsp33 family molecular chaperone HslO [bacterium]